MKNLIEQAASDRVSLIAAVGTHREIGKDNRLLWRLPEDLRRFREKTKGKPVIMGRKTWESLPDAFRPLPGRLNIVMSRNSTYPARGALLVASLDEALLAAKGSPEIFVIGGAALYRQAMPIAGRLYLTEVDDAPEADAFFPAIRPEEWEEASRENARCESGLAFAFVEYRRR